MWGKILLIGGGLGIGGLALLAASKSSASGTSGGGSADDLANDPLFEKFWHLAGREESYCKWGAWNANDVGTGVSVGWVQFNQRYGLLSYLDMAKQDSAAFKQGFGQYAALFADPSWVRSANLNDPQYKNVLLAFMTSPHGMQLQRRAAFVYYWKPVQDYIAQVRPNASDLYKLIAGSLAIQFGPDKWQSWISQSARPEDINYYAQQYAYSKGMYDTANYRFPRQMKNAKSLLQGGSIC